LEFVDVNEMLLRFREHLVRVRARPVFRVTQRRELDGWLLSQARAAGVTFRGGCQVTEIARVGSGFALTTRDGARFTARVLVGADGSRGVVRRFVGTPWSLSRLLEVVTPEDPLQAPEFQANQALFDFSQLGRPASTG